MPNRNRGVIHSILTVITIVVVLVLFGALVYETGVSHTERKLRAEHNTEHYADNVENNVQSGCLILSKPIEIAECAAKETKAAEDARRSEYDLSAQQDMGDWAFWLLWVSVTSVAMTAVGVVFVWRTLLYTRDALVEARSATVAANRTIDVTREIGQSQTRAYITFSGVGYSIPEGVDPQNIRKLAFEAKWDITGQTPALNVHYHIVGIPGHRGATPDFLREVPLPHSFRSYGSEKSRKIGDIIFDLEELERLLAQLGHIWMLAYIEYSDIFGSTFYYSERIKITPSAQPVKIYIRGLKPAGFSIHTEGIWGEVRRDR